MTASISRCKAFLPYPDSSRRYFDQLIIVDEFEGLFKRVRNRRRQQNVLVASCRSDVGKFFLFRWIDRQITGSTMDSNDHAFIDVDPRSNYQATAVLQVK